MDAIHVNSSIYQGKTIFAKEIIMKVWNSIASLPSFTRTVLTIGSFDGVHLGHQKILARLKELANILDAESVLITFNPHPRTVVANNNNQVELLTTADEKIHLLERYSVNNLVIIPFTREFSELSPAAFISDFLVQKFRPAAIAIGYNHKYGKDRAGDLELLLQYGKIYNFEVEEIKKEALLEWEISSTHIRQALNTGAITKANQLLGHPYFFEGIVIKGLQLGRTIGYPTANIHIEDHEKLIPSDGVYVVRVMRKDQVLRGMMSIGGRPTIDRPERLIEVNIFDFDEVIYGEKIFVELLQYLRGIEKFDGLESLTKQLALDKLASLAYFDKQMDN